MTILAVGCASSEKQEFSDEEIQELNQLDRQEQKVVKESSVRKNQVFETLCGEFSKDNTDCKKAARDVCQNHKIKLLQIKRNVSCEKSINNHETIGTCKKVTFTCK